MKKNLGLFSLLIFMGMAGWLGMKTLTNDLPPNLEALTPPPGICVDGWEYRHKWKLATSGSGTIWFECGNNKWTVRMLTFQGMNQEQMGDLVRQYGGIRPAQTTGWRIYPDAHYDPKTRLITWECPASIEPCVERY